MNNFNGTKEGTQTVTLKKLPPVRGCCISVLSRLFGPIPNEQMVAWLWVGIFLVCGASAEEYKQLSIWPEAPGVARIQHGESSERLTAGHEEMFGDVRVGVGSAGQLIISALENASLSIYGCAVTLSAGGWVILYDGGGEWEGAEWAQEPGQVRVPAVGGKWVSTYAPSAGDRVFVMVDGKAAGIQTVDWRGCVDVFGREVRVGMRSLRTAEEEARLSLGMIVNLSVISYSDPSWILADGKGDIRRLPLPVGGSTIADAVKNHGAVGKKAVLRRGTSVIDLDLQAATRRLFPGDIVAILP